MTREQAIVIARELQSKQLLQACPTLRSPQFEQWLTALTDRVADIIQKHATEPVNAKLLEACRKVRGHLSLKRSHGLLCSCAELALLDMVRAAIADAEAIAPAPAPATAVAADGEEPERFEQE